MNKNLSKKLVMLSLVGALSVTEAEITYAHPKYYNQTVTYDMVPTVVATTNVEVRNNFNYNSQVIGFLCAGQMATLIADYGNFYQINYNGIICYVDKRFVYESNQIVMTSSMLGKEQMFDDALFYTDYGNGITQGIIPEDAYVDVYSDDGTLLFVKYGNQVGYIKKEDTYEYEDYYDYDWHDNHKRHRSRHHYNR